MQINIDRSYILPTTKGVMSPPQLSIVISTYNYAHYLPEAIDSILAQDFPSLELIVINDGSTDNTEEVIRKYQREVPYLRYIKYETNKGIHYAINHSIELAQGTYIHWLAADDFRSAHFVKKSMQLLLDNPHIGICCSDNGYAEETKGRHCLLSNPLLRDVKQPLILNPQDIVKLLRTTNFWLPGHTTIVKKASVIKCGGFKKDLLEKCDWFLSYQIALQEGLIYIPETLSYLYQHSQSYSFKTMAQKAMQKLVAKKILNYLELSEHRSLKKLFSRSTLLRGVYKEIPGEFLKFKNWEATFFFITRRIRRYFRIVTFRGYLNKYRSRLSKKLIYIINTYV